jgi:ribosomal protein S18 acetylase RimI-like enzyme
MDICDWAPANVGDLADVYNTQVAVSVPHCYVVSPEEFRAGCYQKTGDDYRSALAAERVIVGIQGGKVRGFAHVTVGEIEHQDRRLTGGFIHFMTYAVGHRDIGQAILAACERHINVSGATTIRAFDGYFYRFHHLGFPLVSDRMGHVYGLFGMNDYKPAGEGEIFFEYVDYPVVVPVAPDPVVKVQVQRQEGQGDLPNITVRALRAGQEIGSCIALSGGDYCRAREAQDRILIDGLGITGKDQGRGWGQYLLARTLHEARQLGYRHTVISTGKRNYRAQLFYANYGYRVTDTVYGFVKETEHPV